MNGQVINISLPTKLLKLADEVAKTELRSRSELFREAIRSYLLERFRMQSLYYYAQNQAKKMKIKEKDVEKIIADYRRAR
ncbi:ribbon-helix-helix protein, CopG family [Candidatus Gottesmanbacteria bacterium]|nr:ribbon-helix-helix protein, CopG family [Candidatus Gottesmanbacteria bacterium]